MKKLSPSAQKTFISYIHCLRMTYDERPTIPPTREEILMASKGDKKDLKDLEKIGLLKSQLVILNENHPGGSSTKGRNIFFLTTLGEEFATHMGLEVPKPKTAPVVSETVLETPAHNPTEVYGDVFGSDHIEDAIFQESPLDSQPAPTAP
jgi:hypothetical protein